MKNIAQTFAPRASGNTGKNPATKGSVLYDIFTYQAWVLLAVGGLLSYNLIFPSEKPDIARLMGCAPVAMPLPLLSELCSTELCSSCACMHGRAHTLLLLMWHVLTYFFLVFRGRDGVRGGGRAAYPGRLGSWLPLRKAVSLWPGVITRWLVGVALS